MTSSASADAASSSTHDARAANSLPFEYFSDARVKKFLPFDELFIALKQFLVDYSATSDSTSSSSRDANKTNSSTTAASLTPDSRTVTLSNPLRSWFHMPRMRLTVMPAHYCIGNSDTTTGAANSSTEFDYFASKTLALPFQSDSSSTSAETTPPLSSFVMLIDAGAGHLKAIMSGEHITGVRTAAVSAIASQLLMHPRDARHAQITSVGSGFQAWHHACAHMQMLSSTSSTSASSPPRSCWKRFVLTSARLPARLTALHSLQARLTAAFPWQRFEVERDLERACRTADVICLNTCASEPVIRADWLKPSCHVNSIAVPGPELDQETLLRARLVTVDSVQSARAEAREFAAGTEAAPVELGSLLARGDGGVGGAQSDDEAVRQQLTVFKSLGLAGMDLVAAQITMKNWEKAGSLSTEL